MRKHLIPIGIGIILLCFMTWLQATNNAAVTRIRNRFESLFYAEFLANTTIKATRESPRIVIVDIDEASIAKVGRWPWPRKTMIDLVNQVRTQGAAVIAFDIVFGEADENPVDLLENLARQSDPGDAQTMQALNKLRPLVLSDADFAKVLSEKKVDTVLGFIANNDSTSPSSGGAPVPVAIADPSHSSLITFSRYFSSIPILQDAVGSSGFLTGIPDIDGVIRRAPLIARIGNNIYPSLALQATRAYMEENKIGLDVDAVKVGKATIPTDEAGQIIIPFDFNEPRYSRVHASELLAGIFPKDIFQGALVFVGSSSFRFGDLHATPLSGVFPGVDIQAIIAESLVSGRSLYTPSWARTAEVIFTVILGLLLALLLPFLGTLGTVVVVILALIALVGIYAYFFMALGMVFAVTASMLQVSVNGIFNLAYGFVSEGSRRKELKSLFGQYVPQEHVEMMIEHPESYSGKGKSANLTVLFADIIGFTSIVQRLSAEETSSILNQFFTPMTKIIFQNHGTIDKYVGDMLMAFWGAPIADAQHVKHALTSALAMRVEVKALKADFKARGLPEIEIGIGINTGDMFVGDMGSEFRRTYTVLGDAVNLASRVESLARYYGVHVIVAEATTANQDEFVFRLLDRVRVVGRSVGVEIYELVSLKSDLTKEQESEIEANEHALRLYFAQDWENAKAAFTSLSQQYPDAKLYKMFLDRIDQLSKSEMPADWDGVYQWASK